MRRRWRLGQRGALAIAGLGAFACAACGVFAEQPVIAAPTPAVQPNVLQNAGFEQGADPWFAASPDRQFRVTNLKPGTGTLSLRLELPAGDAAPGPRIAGATQRIVSDTFPEFVSGYYYVDSWESPGMSPYVEFVVSIRGGGHPDGSELHEVHFMLGGAAREPFTSPTEAFVFLSRDEPSTGQWTYFSYPVPEAIRSRLGWDPIGWEYLELSLAVRDREGAADGAAVADVYFDDLYLGPQLFNPNRPEDD
ncbi:MAG: hypothetical protein WEB52_00815 [Dehalococcoidia bacterium]